MVAGLYVLPALNKIFVINSGCFQDPAEQISNSRRSSTDSDRTIKLEIDETQFCVNEEEGEEEKEVEAEKEEEDIKPKKRKTRRSDSSETSESVSLFLSL